MSDDTMSRNPDRLYELLPTIIRMRDADQGHPLQALMRVIARQVHVVEEDIAQLYDNWFIETCEDWVVPYIGALIGYEPVEDASGTVSAARDKVLIPRREVANTIRYRRRKGALSLLDSLGMDVSGWPAVAAVEFFTRIAALEHLRFPDSSIDTLDLRDKSALGYLGSPFDASPRTLSFRSEGLGAPGSAGIALFVWRLRTYSVTHTDASRLDENQPEYYTFSVLGNDAPLYTRPVRRPQMGEIDPHELPIPITRQALEDDLQRFRDTGETRYYGADKSFAIEIDGWPTKANRGLITPDKLVAADLSDLDDDGVPHYRVERGLIAVDPELGRIYFAPNQRPRGTTRVWYHYGFSADIGGGEYDRPLSPSPAASDSHDVHVIPAAQLGETLRDWQEAPDRKQHTLIEIEDSGVYERDLPELELHPGQSLHIRALNRRRPVILSGERYVSSPEGLTVTAHPGSCLILDGLLIGGRGLRVLAPETGWEEPAPDEPPSNPPPTDPPPRDEQPPAPAAGGGERMRLATPTLPDPETVNIIIRHCTLVPGWLLRTNGDPRFGQGASIELVNVRARLSIERSIVGSISVAQENGDLDPSEIVVADSILDSTAPDEPALFGEDDGTAYAALTVRRSTVFGTVLPRQMPLAENSIFRDTVMVERRQIGCMRFCYVPPGSRTPRRYRCQPDLAIQAAETALREAYEAEYEQAVRDGTLPLPPMTPPTDEIEAVRAGAPLRVYPQFNSVRYGKPAYAQLASTCPPEIARGAEAEGEMGVYYHLFNPQREANLRVRLEEFIPVSARAAIIYAS